MALISDSEYSTRHLRRVPRDEGLRGLRGVSNQDSEILEISLDWLLVGERDANKPKPISLCALELLLEETITSSWVSSITGVGWFFSISSSSITFEDGALRVRSGNIFVFLDLFSDTLMSIILRRLALHQIKTKNYDLLSCQCWGKFTSLSASYLTKSSALAFIVPEFWKRFSDFG